MAEKIRKAAILTGFHPEKYTGGIETFTINLQALLNKNDIDVDIHALVPEPTLPVNPFPGNLIRNRVPDFLLRCYMLGRAFKQREKDYDLVISNNFYGLGYWNPGVKSFAVYHSTHAAYADALRGVSPDHQYKALKYQYGHIGDRLAGRRKAKIAVSESVKAELFGYYRMRDVVVANHGVDTEFFRKIPDVAALRKRWSVPEDACVGIYVGRWEPGKGIDILEAVMRMHPHLVWILAIGPSECPVDEPTIRVIKNADRTTLRELYSLSDFMLFPSYYEGFGLVLTEAMACGLPCICTQVGIAKELRRFDVLKEFILPQGDKSTLIREIAGRIETMQKGGPVQRAWDIAARSIVIDHYSMNIWEEQMASSLGLKD